MSTADGAVLGTTQIAGNAPRNRAFNVVLLAEGFTAAQQTAFNNACTAFVNAFFATAPFDELRPAINAFRVNVRSTDAGADDPTSVGGTGATARTYFDASFGGNGIRRLLVCNATTALQVAAAQGQVAEEQGVVNDEQMGPGQSPPGLEVEAAVVVPALAAQAVARVALHQVPHRPQRLEAQVAAATLPALP